MDYARLQSELRTMPRRDALKHFMCETGRSRSWCDRHYPKFMALPPDELRITYADPTGEKASRLADNKKATPEPSAKIRSKVA